MKIPALASQIPVATSWLVMNIPQLEMGIITQAEAETVQIKKASISRGTLKRSVTRFMAAPTDRMARKSSTNTTMLSSQVVSRALRSPRHSREATCVKPWVPPDFSNKATRLPKIPTVSITQIQSWLPSVP